ncbi:flagellar protein FlaG [Nitrosospira sp. Is2]|uniref:flagellar protein FlaG n=1 Tax=Nitrosospira sp. Is2 TaxID=3080532 RepID=UPI00295500B9|nr:flagellar protein FlaG [Nitrosospira sp. Is2]WON73600.1 flagellar protein FlaG [Nitrosospira sp. Is2]
MGIEQLAAVNLAVMGVKPASTATVSAGPARQPEQAQNREEPLVAAAAAAAATPGVARAEANSMEFSLDSDSGRVVVKIIDSATQEVVRQIPMEEMLALAKALDKFQGLLLHTKA